MSEVVGRFRDGRAIRAVTLSSAALHVRLLSVGAAVQDIRLAGVEHPLVLGFARAEAYCRNPPYLGAIVGRVANRIGGGSGLIDGRRYAFDLNEGGMTTLHGGSEGSSARLWDLVDFGPDFAVFSHVLPDGHMGFPGDLQVEARYGIAGSVLTLDISAQTSAPTLCSFAPHCYFNLSGAPTIDDHRVAVAADRILPVERGIPTGGPIEVAGTPYDLRAPVPTPSGIDTNYCVAAAPRGMTPVATVSAGAVRLTVETTEPGLQVYDGSGLSAEGGLDGRRYGPRAGLALEPQRWPDAVNKPWRAQTDLAPGERYAAATRFAFAREPEHQT